MISFLFTDYVAFIYGFLSEIHLEFPTFTTKTFYKLYNIALIIVLSKKVFSYVLSIQICIDVSWFNDYSREKNLKSCVIYLLKFPTFESLAKQIVSNVFNT